MRQKTQRRWRILRRIDAESRALAETLGIHPVSACVLLNRNLTEPAALQHFLNPSLESLHDPYLMKDMDKAVARLRQAIDGQERVMIHGDYDVDGVAATAMMVRMLSALGVDVTHHIPHRVDEGYGVSAEGIRQAAANGVKLVVTVDCGISAYEEALLARELGLDLIITDHHQPPPAFESQIAYFGAAVAVLNPNRPDCGYPFKGLCGCGVAYKLATALVENLGHPGNALQRAYLDLTALATIADIVPLRDENRAIAQFGLERLSDTKKPGLKALMGVCGIAGKRLSSYHVGFVLGPRLNAAGRLDTAETALNLLLTRDDSEAGRLADALNQLNRERQEEESSTLQDAELMIESGADALGGDILLDSDKALVLASEDWHMGVVGIVASRLAERYVRPTILITMGEDEGKGSGRSIRAFDLKKGLDGCADYLVGYGGHAQAAGLTVTRGQLSQFRARFLQVADEQLGADDLIPVVDIDCELGPRDLTFELVNELRRFEPYGHENPGPVFAIRGAKLLDQCTVGANGKHLKLRVGFWEASYDASGGAREDNFGRFSRHQLLDLCFSLDINEYQGIPSMQFVVKDVQPS